MKTLVIFLIAASLGTNMAVAGIAILPLPTVENSNQIRYAGLELVPLAEPKLGAPSNDTPVTIPSAPVEPISFTGPLTVGDKAVIGKTLEQLIAGSPLFSPIEGLPAEVWKGKKCTECHGWTAEALCTQGATYLKEKTAVAINKQHPYGGGLKLNLKFWAEQGCE